jgi:hypothetical protein
MLVVALLNHGNRYGFPKLQQKDIGKSINLSNL